MHNSSDKPDPSSLHPDNLLDPVYYDLLNKLNLQECRAIESELKKEIKILSQLLENKDFGVGPDSIGSELELALVDHKTLKPALINFEICDYYKSNNTANKQINIQTELAKFCLEYNGPIILSNQQPLNSLSNDMELFLWQIQKTALEQFNATVVPIGIIPTLDIKNLTADAMTPNWRYHAIDKTLRSLRANRDFELSISGENSIHKKWCNTLIGGVTSSYQVHLRVNPIEFNDLYNAAQLAQSFVLAVSGNSPLLFGHKLWEESRIAVLEQTANNHNDQKRVSFGRGWIKDGALGLLTETCELFHPILPINFDSIENIYDRKSAKNNSAYLLYLPNLTQHNSTVWPWNRAIYDAASGGHFRIEMRALPAGPTTRDMVMNAGFLLGLTKALSSNVSDIISNLPFKYAQYNFYQAAEHGLKANCIWLNSKNNTIKEIPIINLLDQMLDFAAFGLNQLGVSDLEINSMQSIIRARYINQQTGAIWQRKVFDKLISKHKLNTKEALEQMFKLYIENSARNQPVASWSL